MPHKLPLKNLKTSLSTLVKSIISEKRGMEINRQQFLTGDGEEGNKRIEVVLIFKGCSINKHAMDAVKSL